MMRELRINELFTVWRHRRVLLTSQSCVLYGARVQSGVTGVARCLSQDVVFRVPTGSLADVDSLAIVFVHVA